MHHAGFSLLCALCDNISKYYNVKRDILKAKVDLRCKKKILELEKEKEKIIQNIENKYINNYISKVGILNPTT